MRIIVLTIMGLVFTVSNFHCGNGNGDSGDSIPLPGNGNGGTVTTLIITNTGSEAVTIGFVCSDRRRLP
jgi:hypothetical protein